MGYNYAFNEFDSEKMARAVGKDLPISTKQAIEISNSLRKKDVKVAEKLLQQAIDMEKAIPYTRFNKGTGHKAGIAAGKYPIKSCTHILALLKSAESNAAQKNLSNLIIRHICAQRAAHAYRYGRRGGLQAKRTNVEIVLAEKTEKKVEKK